MERIMFSECADGKSLLNQKSRGFTLIELLVVVAIIALLAAILVPAVTEARHQARVVLCLTRLRSFAQGLNFWALDDLKGEYPPHPLWLHRIYSSDFGAPAVFAAAGFLDRSSFNRAFSERVTGGAGSGVMLWCPFEVEFAYGHWIMEPPSFDPRWPGIINTGGNSMILYQRFAAAEYRVDWTHSGNSQTDGPPMEPGLADDAIVADHIGGDIGDFRFRNAHSAERSNLSSSGTWYIDFRSVTHRENNVAYGDGHAETHYHKFDEFLAWPHWDGEYVIQEGQGFLY